MTSSFYFTMNYDETIQYLYNSTPVFEKIGAGAYKEGLSITHLLDEHFNHPHRCYKTIHIAGTNGKGSCSHTIAAILQAAGYKVGLYTSPHLVDFRERIRVNGKPVGKDYVIDFVKKERAFFEPLHPSFFELTTAMALKYFADEQVDVAVIEVGLGGRLDCTNIISPDLCVITNISFDHTQFLGHTLAAIAGEKAGIIKEHTPVVIGETVPETKRVFEKKAGEMHAPIIFAEDERLLHTSTEKDGHFVYQTRFYPHLEGELTGFCQIYNTNTILSALRQLVSLGYHISDKAVCEGFSHVCELTGLMGRWQTIQRRPLVICDTGHNVGGFEYIARQIRCVTCRQLRIVIGMVDDKDYTEVLSMLPAGAVYYFTQAAVKRAVPVDIFYASAQKAGLEGRCFPSVMQAYHQALKEAGKDDFIFVGGSSYIVSDLLQGLQEEK